MLHLLLAVIYLSFISLGLPDSLLGSAWPSMYQGFGVPVSYSGIIFFIISVGTVISSLQSDRLTRRLGAGKVTAVSVGMTAAALFGFSVSGSFWAMCLWAVPYGLGAGSVDAALNNYVALHFASRHMSWLHCMWGLGASIGPYIMGAALSYGAGWPVGYRTISVMQLGLTVIIALSLPLWRTKVSADAAGEGGAASQTLTLRQIVRIPGVKAVMVTFFCYCALEQTAGLWASSYLVLHKGVAPETAASFASLFFIGITIGRALCGFLTLKLNDTQLIRMGQVIIAMGVAAFLLPLGEYAASHWPGLCSDLSQHHPLHSRPFRRGEISGDHRRPDGQRLSGQLPHAAAVRYDCQSYYSVPVSLLSAGNLDFNGVHARGSAEKQTGGIKMALHRWMQGHFYGVN